MESHGTQAASGVSCSGSALNLRIQFFSGDGVVPDSPRSIPMVTSDSQGLSGGGMVEGPLEGVSPALASKGLSSEEGVIPKRKNRKRRRI